MDAEGVRLAERRVRILGVPVDPVTMEEAVMVVDDFIDRYRSDGCSRLVLTPNPEIIQTARRDGELMEVLQEADLAVADGAGILWAARVLGLPVPERIPGIDLMERLLLLSARKGYRVFFLGSRPPVVEQAAMAAMARYPGLTVAGWRHGYFRPEEEGSAIRAIRAARPDLLFTGMGAPRDQKWLGRNRKKLNVPVSMGVGGSFDVMAGSVRRAPFWMRRVHLEWLFRLLQQPSRWRRMLALPRFARDVWSARGGHGDG